MHVSTSSRLLLTVMVGILLAAPACSSHTSSTHGRGNRTVDVTMTDNRFQPIEFTAAKGETVTFKFKNDGTVVHEAFIGDKAAQDKHQAEMAVRKPGTTGTLSPSGSTPGSTPSGSVATPAHGHAEAVPDDHGHSAGGPEVSVDPGKTGDLTYTFKDSGTVIIGCHEPGHFDAGMKALVNVT